MHSSSLLFFWYSQIKHPATGMIIKKKQKATDHKAFRNVTFLLQGIQTSLGSLTSILLIELEKCDAQLVKAQSSTAQRVFEYLILYLNNSPDQAIIMDVI